MSANIFRIRLGHGVLCHKDGTAILIGLDGGLIGADLLCHVNNVLLIKSNQGTINRKLANLIDYGHGSQRLRCHLSDALSRNEAKALRIQSQLLRETHHVALHDNGQLLMRTGLINMKLNVRKVDHVKIDGTRVLRHDPRKVNHLLLCALTGIGRRMEINCIDLDASLCNHIARHRRIDAAGQKKHGLSTRTDGHAARSRNDFRIQINLLADLHVQHDVWVMNVHRHLGIRVQKDLAKIRIDLHGLLGVILPRAARIHLKGLVLVGIHLVDIVHDALRQLLKALILGVNHGTDA